MSPHPALSVGVKALGDLRHRLLARAEPSEEDPKWVLTVDLEGHLDRHEQN